MLGVLKIAVLATVLVGLAACATDPTMKPWWTLNEGSFVPVKPGVSKTEVRNLLGRPMLEMTFPGLSEEVWDYRYLFGTRAYITEIHFDLRGAVKYYTQHPDPAIYDPPE